MTDYILYTLITLEEFSKQILDEAYKSGINGSTILSGFGSVKSKFLKFLGFSNSNKEIILIIARKNIGDNALKNIKNKIDITKKHRGIIFTNRISEIHGIYESSNNFKNNIKEGSNKMDKIIISIVDKDLGNDVVDCATKLGAKGATIIKGRGGGKNNITKIFNFEIEPEKDIVLIVVKNDIKDKIVSGINEKMQIKDPNKGIVFVIDAVETYGLSS